MSSSVKGGGGSDMNWFARSKGSKTVPLRTLMLDPEVQQKAMSQAKGEARFQ